MVANLAMSIFALGCMFPLIAGPLLTIILDRDLSWVIIPSTFSIWAIALVLGILSRQTDEGKRAARWSAHAIVFGLTIMLIMEVRGRMDKRKNANTSLHGSSESRASASSSAP
jgi:hypothetical protein